VVLVAACGDDGVSASAGTDSGSTGESETTADSSETGGMPDVPPEGETVHLEGVVQKGPFVEGSTITISPLSPTGEPAGEVQSTTTVDDFGHFSFYVDSAGPKAIEANGFYYNEVVGARSEAAMRLRAHQVTTGAFSQQVNVNLVTHLSSGRVETLVAVGMSFADAIEQAEEELRVALGIGLVGFDPDRAGSEMDVFGGNTLGNAYLLAVSSVLAQVAVEADGVVDEELQALIDDLSGDFADDGEIAAMRRARIEAGELALDVDEVTSTLAERVAAMGATVEIPDMHDVLDQDDDLLLNVDDNCDRIPNPRQVDADFDAVGDECDNCPIDSNPDQADSTGTGVGDACNNTCGDGFAGPFELCDDGANGDDTDRCTDFCQPPICGDGIHWANEECDDGNFTDGDGCNSDCTISGGISWQLDWNTVGADRCNGMAVDSLGSVVIGGQLDGASGFLQTYDANGALLVDEAQATAVLDLDVYPNDDVLLLADASPEPALLTRVSQAGAPLWSAPGSVAQARVLVVDDVDAYYVGGSTALGAPIAAQYGGMAIEAWTYSPLAEDGVVESIALTLGGEVMVGDAGTSSMWIAFVDAAGLEQWSFEVDVPGDDPRVAVATDGTIVVLYTGPNAEAFARKYSADGSMVLWTFDPDGEQDQAIGDIAIDLAGHVAIAHRDEAGENGRVTKLAPEDGDVIWEEIIDETGQDHPDRVEFDNVGNLFACVRTDAEQDSGVLLIKFLP
jgi:cysteine-rich repeat protein